MRVQNNRAHTRIQGVTGRGAWWTWGVGKAGDTIAVVIISGLPVSMLGGRRYRGVASGHNPAPLNGKIRIF